MKDKIISWLKEHKSILLIIVETGILIMLALVYWHIHSETPSVVTTSQKQAETTAGVKEVAKNANTAVTDSQAKEISTVIKEIRVTEKEPVYIVQTTGKKAKEESEKQAKLNNADFAIVTDKDNPDEEVNLNELDKDKNVTLNQYNIQAYKKHINTIEYQPTEKVVGYTHQWRITKSGRYIGVGADYDIDDKRVYAKVTYSW